MERVVQGTRASVFRADLPFHQMTIEPVGPRQYRITSGDQVYWVDLNASGAASICDCPAGIWKGTCKHIDLAREQERFTLEHT